MLYEYEYNNKNSIWKGKKNKLWIIPILSIVIR